MRVIWSLSVVVGLLVVVVEGLIAHRLGIEVPRTLRGWEDAVAARARVTVEARSEPPVSR